MRNVQRPRDFLRYSADRRGFSPRGRQTRRRVPPCEARSAREQIGRGRDALEIYAVARVKAKKSGNPTVAAMKRDLAKKSLTKAERDERKAAKLEELVEQ
jgi:hypothetical protein